MPLSFPDLSLMTVECEPARHQRPLKAVRSDPRANLGAWMHLYLQALGSGGLHCHA